MLLQPLSAFGSLFACCNALCCCLLHLDSPALNPQSEESQFVFLNQSGLSRQIWLLTSVSCLTSFFSFYLSCHCVFFWCQIGVKQTFSVGCAHGQAYSDMKRKYVHDLCAISVICTGRRAAVWLYSCDTALQLWTKCSDSHDITVLLFSVQISLQSWVMFPLNGVTSLEKFSYRENNIAVVFRGQS